MVEPKLIVFDVDGTLVDSQLVIIAAMRAAYGALGLEPPTDRETLSIVGLSLFEAMRVLSPEGDQATVGQLVEAYRASFLERRKQARGEESVPLYDGARDCLNLLNSMPEVVLGVATGKARRGLDLLIEAHQLDGLFVTKQTADFHPSKPDPAMLLAACQEVGIAPECAVMVGDTSFDMEMGKAAGLATIGVKWGYHDEARLGRHADVMVDRFDQVEAAIYEVLGWQIRH